MIIPVVLVKAESGYAVKPQHLVPKNNSVSTGGRSGPPLRGGFGTEHTVKPMIRKPKENPTGTGGHSGTPLRGGFVNEHDAKPNS